MHESLPYEHEQRIKAALEAHLQRCLDSSVPFHVSSLGEVEHGMDAAIRQAKETAMSDPAVIEAVREAGVSVDDAIRLVWTD